MTHSLYDKNIKISVIICSRVKYTDGISYCYDTMNWLWFIDLYTFNQEQWRYK